MLPAVPAVQCFLLKAEEENISPEQVEHGLKSNFMGGGKPLSSRAHSHKERLESLPLPGVRAPGPAVFWLLWVPSLPGHRGL